MKIFSYCCLAYILFSCFVFFTYFKPFSRFALRFDRETFIIDNTESKDVQFIFIPNQNIPPKCILDYTELNNIAGIIYAHQSQKFNLPLGTFSQNFDIAIKTPDQPIAIRNLSSFNISEILHMQPQKDFHAKTIVELKRYLFKFSFSTFITLALFFTLVFLRNKLGFKLSTLHIFSLIACSGAALVNLIYFSLSVEYIYFLFKYI